MNPIHFKNLIKKTAASVLVIAVLETTVNKFQVNVGNKKMGSVNQA